jgi:hypothetical protein
MEILRRIRWYDGPCIAPQNIWLDWSPAQGGLRFLGSALEAPGRRSDRAICGRFTGQWAYGQKGLYLTAADGDVIQLGDSLLSLHPTGFAPGARSLLYQSPEGDFLYAGGYGRCTLPGEAARHPKAAVLVLGARWPLLPLEGESDRVLADVLAATKEILAAGGRAQGSCNDLFFGLELALELDRRFPGELALGLPSRVATRWQFSGGRLPGAPLGVPGVKLQVAQAVLAGACQVHLKGGAGAQEFGLRRACSRQELVEAARASGATLALLFGEYRDDWREALEGHLECRLLEAAPQRQLFPRENM